MPKDPGLNKILLLGSGPIIIGQACEFDYSGTQACRALREEGCRIILVNSNPATVMTDPALSDRTYIEPMSVDVLAEIIRQERPEAILPTLGGQTALNLAIDLAENGVLEECGVRMIGAEVEVIRRAEDREIFRDLMTGAGLFMAAGRKVREAHEALDFAHEHGFPVVVRPSFTLGGTGGGIAYNLAELQNIVAHGLGVSPVHEVLVEQSLLGWKEIELELIRDKTGNYIVVCGIENFDPMGIHTGDSITVAPIQTLTEAEYQELRKQAMAIVEAVGLESGGCNIQFAVDPVSGRVAVVEMNPRVSRSSALASKATGFPIARVSVKLALGYTLDELTNGVNSQSCANFEPVLDYCAVKAPRFDFEKFPGADTTLGFQMKSVGETMALGGNFREALQKSLRGLEIGQSGFGERKMTPGEVRPPLDERLREAGAYRIFHLKEALAEGYDLDRLHELTAIDPWFLDQLRILHEREKTLARDLAPFFTGEARPGPAEKDVWREIKAHGFSDAQIVRALNQQRPEPLLSEAEVRERRLAAGAYPCFRAVDTCAEEFEAYTPYFYSTYQVDPENDEVPAPAADNKRVMILGGGPNRIGQGVEFDYCCVQAALALRDAGWETVMINSNPETVSTDYDMADILFFEPLTVEDILAVCRVAKPFGALVQCGGQTPLNLSRALQKAGLRILGTSPDDIFKAEDRGAFNKLAASLGIKQPQGGQAANLEDACRIALRVGYPVMVRPDFVLGGRAMRIINDEDGLHQYWDEALAVSPEGSVFVDRFLEDAVEMDVDALCDGQEVIVAAIMEHVEQAGVHSGDSACSIFPHTFTPDQLRRIEGHTRDLALALNTRGLINIQYAIQNDDIYLLEANPRASRTVPFVAKATGWPLARLAALVMLGAPLADLPPRPKFRKEFNAVKEVKIPYDRFPGATVMLGAEMRSTGEVMGIGETFGQAFLKAQLAAGHRIPQSGGVLLSICDHDKPRLERPARALAALGYKLYGTEGTSRFLRDKGLDCEPVSKIGGRRPDLLDLISDDLIQLTVNTVSGQGSSRNALQIRAENLKKNTPTYTTISALEALVEGLQQWESNLKAAALQDYY